MLLVNTKEEAGLEKSQRVRAAATCVQYEGQQLLASRDTYLGGEQSQVRRLRGSMHGCTHMHTQSGGAAAAEHLLLEAEEAGRLQGPRSISIADSSHGPLQGSLQIQRGEH
jgi:hypothetical protein